MKRFFVVAALMAAMSAPAIAQTPPANGVARVASSGNAAADLATATQLLVAGATAVIIGITVYTMTDDDETVTTTTTGTN